MEPTTLQTAWYVLLGAIWVLYLVLGGTDLGVGQLVQRTDRATALRAIGPTWAANDVWLIIAVAITLGAFPGWYAELMSGAYVPLIALVAAVMSRHGAIELVGHASGPAAERRFERLIVATSFAIPFLWGVIWAGAIDGTLAATTDAGLSLFTPTGVVAGLALTTLCRLQGLAFLRMRLPEIRSELGALRSTLAAVGAAVLAAAVLGGTAVDGVSIGPVGGTLAVLGGAGAALALRAARSGRDARLWLGAALTTTGAVSAFLAALYRAPIAGSGPHQVSLAASASGANTLGAMLVISVVLLPLLLAVLAYGYLHFIDPPSGTPRNQFRGLLARASRGTLTQLR